LKRSTLRPHLRKVRIGLDPLWAPRHVRGHRYLLAVPRALGSVRLPYTEGSEWDEGGGFTFKRWAFKRWARRHDLVAMRIEALGTHVPKARTEYPRAYTISLGGRVLDRFTRNADGSWTHHDLSAGTTASIPIPRGPSASSLDV
jgi:hypothetical protein